MRWFCICTWIGALIDSQAHTNADLDIFNSERLNDFAVNSCTFCQIHCFHRRLSTRVKCTIPNQSTQAVARRSVTTTSIQSRHIGYIARRVEALEIALSCKCSCLQVRHCYEETNKPESRSKTGKSERAICLGHAAGQHQTSRVPSTSDDPDVCLFFSSGRIS